MTSDTAVWYHSGQPPVPIRWALIRDPKGKFESRALLCTDVNATPLQIVKWFVLRWQVEATFQEARTHLGLETQRQWSDLATARTTPALFGLFSLVTLLAHPLLRHDQLPVRKATWYRQAMANILGCPGGSTLSVVASPRFSSVAAQDRCGGNPTFVTEKIY